mmetsp:Transcript_25209/g.53571  ORF Transcript_25209/g.53571 Transcript_25209/m.53571 type:complete len:446 (+) Transcript_25209:159-1496(+)
MLEDVAEPWFNHSRNEMNESDWQLHLATFLTDELTWVFGSSDTGIFGTLLSMCFSNVIAIWVWVYRRSIDFFAVTIAIMVVQHIVIVSCDMTQLFLSNLDARFQLAPRRRLSCCVAAWCFTLCLLAPIVFPILSVRPVLLSWCLTVLVVHAYRNLLRLGLGQPGADRMLSMRQLRSYRLQVDLSEYRKDQSASSSALKNWLFYMMLLGYLQATKRQMERHQLLTAATFLCLLYALYLRNFRRPMPNVGCWRLLWDIHAAPIHVSAGHCHESGCLSEEDATDNSGDCDEHSQCAICLDNLCRHQSALHASAWSLATRRRPMLSASRLGHIATSATRSWGSSLYKSLNTGPSTYVAELPCRHRFHLGCIDDAARAKLQCPTCRSPLGQTWHEMTPSERATLRTGGMVVSSLWVLIRIAEHMGWIGSSYLLMTRLLREHLNEIVVVLR